MKLTSEGRAYTAGCAMTVGSFLTGYGAFNSIGFLGLGITLLFGQYLIWDGKMTK